MRNPQVILDILKQKTVQEHFCFERIHRLMYNTEFYKMAQRQVRAIDDTINEVSTNTLYEWILELQNETYRPTSIHTELQEEHQSKERIIEEVLCMILKAIYEPLYVTAKYRCYTEQQQREAFQSIRNHCSDTKWWIQFDMKDMLSTLNGRILCEILKKKINDDKMIRLIHKYLNAGCLVPVKSFRRKESAQRLTALQQVLTNIYLYEKDLELQRLLSDHYFYLRCGTSVLLSIPTNKQDALHCKHQLSSWIQQNEIYLTHNSKRIRYFECDIIIGRNKCRQKGKRSKCMQEHPHVILTISNDCMKNYLCKHAFLKLRTNNVWYAAHNPYLINLNDRAILSYYKGCLSSFIRTYGVICNRRQLRKLCYFLRLSWGRTMASKYKTSVRSIFQRHRKNRPYALTNAMRMFVY